MENAGGRRVEDASGSVALVIGEVAEIFSLFQSSDRPERAQDRQVWSVKNAVFWGVLYGPKKLQILLNGRELQKWVMVHILRTIAHALLKVKPARY